MTETGWYAEIGILLRTLKFNERRDERTSDMLSRAAIAKMTDLVGF